MRGLQTMARIKQSKREPFTQKEIAEIAARIKEVRSMLDLTGNELSLSLGFDRSYISQIEIATLYPTTSLIGLLYKIYNVNPNYILLGFKPIFLSNEPINKSKVVNDEDISSIIDDETLLQEVKKMFNRVKIPKKRNRKVSANKLDLDLKQNESIE